MVFTQALKVGARLFVGVEQVALEAVERFQRADQPGIARLLGNLPVNPGAALKLVLGWALARKDAERLEPRPDQRLRAQRFCSNRSRG